MCIREEKIGGLNEERAVLYSFIALQLLFHMRSLGFALKLVAEEDTMKPTVYPVYRKKSFQNREEVQGRSGKRSFLKSAGRSGEGLEKDFKLFGESRSVRGSPITRMRAMLPGNWFDEIG